MEDKLLRTVDRPKDRLIGKTSPESVVLKLLERVKTKEPIPAGENTIILEGKLDCRYYGLDNDKLGCIDVWCEDFAREQLMVLLPILDERKVRITIEVLE
jgi:hypothetical protein